MFSKISIIHLCRVLLLLPTEYNRSIINVRYFDHLGVLLWLCQNLSFSKKNIQKNLL